MKVRVIESDMRGVPVKTGRLKSNRALGLFLSAEAARLMDKFVPFKTGALAGSANTGKPFEVSYVAPYAMRQYYGDGFNFTRDHHPLARSRWDKGIDKRELARKATIKARSL